MDDLLSLIGTGARSDSVLLALVAATGALFLATLAFSAYAILLRVEHHVRDRRWMRLTAKWRDPVLAAVLDTGRSDSVHALVEPRNRLRFVRFVLEYSRRVRGAERQALRELALPYLDPIAERTTHRRAEVRTRAIQTLGTLGLPDYAEYVLRGLDDPSPLVSMVAARYLARQDFSEYAGPVLDHVGRFDGWHRRFLASMLAAIGPEVSSRLRERLADEAAPGWIRSVMADALRLQLDPRAGDIAAGCLRTGQGRELTAAVLRLLAEVGRPEHAGAVRALCSSPDPLVRAQALHALGNLSDETDLPLLRDAMRDESPWVALHAARGVRELGGGEWLEKLAESDGTRATLAGQVLYEEEVG